MSRYRHLFFDLDHTLWDFEKNSSETLTELYGMFDLARFSFSPEELIEKYRSVNYLMWEDYNRGKLSKEAIRSLRFERTFEALGLEKGLVPPGINEEFLRICPAKGNVMPFVHEVLDYLSGKYVLHIITNGFNDTQSIKIRTSGLEKYFLEVINSERCGYSKPQKEIFEFAVATAGAVCNECLMVGDDLYTDIFGGKNAGMDTVYYNPRPLPVKEKPETEATYEIGCLRELKQIL